MKNIDFCRNLIASIVSEARRRKGGVGDGLFLMPGFNIPNGKSKKYRIVGINGGTLHGSVYSPRWR